MCSCIAIAAFAFIPELSDDGLFVVGLVRLDKEGNVLNSVELGELQSDGNGACLEER